VKGALHAIPWGEQRKGERGRKLNHKALREACGGGPRGGTEGKAKEKALKDASREKSKRIGGSSVRREERAGGQTT